MATKLLFSFFLFAYLFTNAQLALEYRDDSLEPTKTHWKDHTFNTVDWNSNIKKEEYKKLFVQYLVSFRGTPMKVISTNFDALLEFSHQNTASLLFFYEQFDKYLADPNSPLRSEELFEPVLKTLVSSTKLNDTQRSKMQFQLKNIALNRPGTKANDFKYSTPKGNQRNLHSLQNPSFLLVHFSNSGCHACEETFEQLNASVIIEQNLNSQNLSILTIDISKESNKLIPNKPNWHFGLDPEESIEAKGLYHLPAMPSFYLLDKDKKVILKDGTLQQVEMFLQANSK